MDELKREIQHEVSWYMLLSDDIVLIEETRDGLNKVRVMDTYPRI